MAGALPVRALNVSRTDYPIPSLLQVLSLGRNCLKKLENLEAVAGTLQQLWISYNQVDRLVSGTPARSLGCTAGQTEC